MKKKHLLLAFFALTPFMGYSQFWSRSAPNTFLTNPGDFVGIGTSTPLSGGNKFEVVQGGVAFKSGQSGWVRFENPGGTDEGMSIHNAAGTARGDVRLHATTGLRIGCSTGGSVPVANMMHISTGGNFGIGAASGGDKFEINGPAGASGLKLVNLTSAAAPGASIGKVLTVNGTGQVVLVTDANTTYSAGTGLTLSGTTFNSTWTTSGANISNNNAGNVGIGTASPASKLEVNSGIGNTSGLRFTNLNNTNFSAAIPSTGLVLTLNNTGDVVLTTDAGMTYAPGTGISFSGPFINSTWTQTGSNIANNNAGNVGIGVAPTAAKLDLVSTNDFGVRSINNKVPTSSFTIGVSGEANGKVGMGMGGTFIGANTGVYGESQQNLDNLAPGQLGSSIYDIKGIDGFADNFGTTNARWAIGARGQGFASSSIGTAVGVWGYADGATAYGVYGEASGFIGYAGYFNGDVLRTGTDNFTSDRKLKRNIEPMVSALANIMKLRPTTYEFKTDEFKQMHLPGGKRFGFIAQELQEVFPVLVKDARHPEARNKAGEVVAEAVDFKTVSYVELIPVLTKAIQEQQTQIEAQQKQIEELKAAVANNNSGSNNTGISNDQSTDPGSLSQNVPNPFSQNTVIGYKLPVSAKSAAIGIYDLNGKELKLVTLGAERTGSITIDGGSMQAGMYVYTLIVNGNPFATKKMILTSH